MIHNDKSREFWLLSARFGNNGSFAVPRGSYPTPFLGRLVFKITDPNHKTRYPKQGVGYEPLDLVYRPEPQGSKGPDSLGTRF